MHYKNPIIPGFFPDPSICRANGKYYLVCSSFHYFPGVPLFESTDLINWTLIGHVLTTESQLPLSNARSSEGIFAPTIRTNNKRFYMVTTNVSDGGNFYVWTDDPYGPWSDPIYVKQGGIDPSLFFENDTAYFMSNGADDSGIDGITQCEIDIKTGRKLSPSQCIWKGTGGRFLEAPHLYKIDENYYLVASEGGTEYGHMVVYAKGLAPYGPFVPYLQNPVLTNRNLGGHIIQGCGHADLTVDENGNWWMVHLGFRQIDPWIMHHITGREVYLVPVTFDDKAWFTAGDDGTTPNIISTNRLPDAIVQKPIDTLTFDNTCVGKQWCFLRNPYIKNYAFDRGAFYLTGTKIGLSSDTDSPTFIAIRQQEMNLSVTCKVMVPENEAGVTFYMDYDQHYDLAVTKTPHGYLLFKRLCIGDLVVEDCVKKITASATSEPIKLIIDATNLRYHFMAEYGDATYDLGYAQTKYLSSEIGGNFTGVMIGLYAQGNNSTKPAEFTCFSCQPTAYMQSSS